MSFVILSCFSDNNLCFCLWCHNFLKKIDGFHNTAVFLNRKSTFSVILSLFYVQKNMHFLILSCFFNKSLCLYLYFRTFLKKIDAFHNTIVLFSIPINVFRCTIRFFRKTPLGGLGGRSATLYYGLTTVLRFFSIQNRKKKSQQHVIGEQNSMFFVILSPLCKDNR